uniref:Bm13359 n=1 Tax=Brugia malayi TaxID=6279 RepID=A0A1I9G4Q0_BRUMA|nr:Bm13359 [Brugia malayi]
MGKTWTYREQRCIDRASEGWARQSDTLYVVFGG